MYFNDDFFLNKKKMQFKKITRIIIQTETNILLYTLYRKVFIKKKM